MDMTPVDPAGVPAASPGYSNGALVVGASRLLFVSGQVPETAEGAVPETTRR